MCFEFNKYPFNLSPLFLTSIRLTFSISWLKSSAETDSIISKVLLLDHEEKPPSK